MRQSSLCQQVSLKKRQAVYCQPAIVADYCTSKLASGTEFARILAEQLLTPFLFVQRST